MQLVICIIVDRDVDALLVVEENFHHGYWFPFDGIKSGETRALAAKRIANKITPFELEFVDVLKIRSCDALPHLPSLQTYHLFYKERTSRMNGMNAVNSVWMNLEQMKAAIRNQELLGLEPYFILKTVLERHASNNDPSIDRQIFEESIFQYMSCKAPDLNNQLSASAQEQLLGSAKFNDKIQEAIFKEFYSYTFPSDYMNFDNFSQAMDNKLSLIEKNRMDAYFRAFDSQQKSYLTYLDYLVGLAAMDPNTSHGGAPAELRCRFIFRFYNTKNQGYLTLEEFRDLHTDVLSSKVARTSLTVPSDNEILTAFNSFNLYANSQLYLTEFLNSVGQLKYRGTSVLFRLNGYVADSIRPCQRYHADPTMARHPDRTNDKVNYELADHCVTLKKSGQLSRVESLLSMRYNQQLSTTTEAALKHLPRSISGEIFDRRTVATDILDFLRYFEKRDRNKETLTWAPNSYVDLAKAVVNLCREIREIILEEPRCLKLSSPCYILGDIHGNYQDLICFEKSLWRATPLLTPASFIFLGDYVDRGIYGLEVIIYLLATKYQCPRKVALLRGNHEIRKVQQMFSFYKECLGKFGDALGREVWDAINSVFDVLPLAAVIDDQILCLHGGIPSPGSCPGDFVSTVNNVSVPLADPEMESSLAWEIMWNDPFSVDNNSAIPLSANVNNGFFNNTRRSTGKYFTNDALVAFLEKNHFTHVVRAHEVQQIGFKVQLGGRLLTVFSSSHYCGGTNKAATVLVDAGKLRLIQLDAT